jgi:hypothetical protein
MKIFDAHIHLSGSENGETAEGIYMNLNNRDVRSAGLKHPERG